MSLFRKLFYVLNLHSQGRIEILIHQVNLLFEVCNQSRSNLSELSFDLRRPVFYTKVERVEDSILLQPFVVLLFKVKFKVTLNEDKNHLQV